MACNKCESTAPYASACDATRSNESLVSAPAILAAVTAGWCLGAKVAVDLTLKHGWRTGAIVPELRKEIKIMNTEEYVHTVSWMQALTGLIEQMQVRRDAASQAVVGEWIREREAMRPLTKQMFNPQFGSLFRTYHNPTYFSRRLSRFADIYMASISCLLNYDFQHTFFPHRTPLQHESPLVQGRAPAAGPPPSPPPPAGAHESRR